eukprot:scaffold65593_cov63-Phaeocystis_antarctica.AAC.2
MLKGKGTAADSNGAIGVIAEPSFGCRGSRVAGPQQRFACWSLGKAHRPTGRRPGPVGKPHEDQSAEQHRGDKLAEQKGPDVGLGAEEEGGSRGTGLAEEERGVHAARRGAALRGWEPDSGQPAARALDTAGGDAGRAAAYDHEHVDERRVGWHQDGSKPQHRLNELADDSYHSYHAKASGRGATSRQRSPFPQEEDGEWDEDHLRDVVTVQRPAFYPCRERGQEPNAQFGHESKRGEGDALQKGDSGEGQDDTYPLAWCGDHVAPDSVLVY